MQNGQSIFLASLPSLALYFNLVPDLLFDCSCVFDYAKIRTVLQSKKLYLTNHSIWKEKFYNYFEKRYKSKSVPLVTFIVMDYVTCEIMQNDLWTSMHARFFCTTFVKTFSVRFRKL